MSDGRGFDDEIHESEGLGEEYRPPADGKEYHNNLNSEGFMRVPQHVHTSSVDDHREHEVNTPSSSIRRDYHSTDEKSSSDEDKDARSKSLGRSAPHVSPTAEVESSGDRSSYGGGFMGSITGIFTPSTST